MKTRLTSLAAAALACVASSFAQSEPLKPEFVDTLLDPYFELQTALAEDSLQSAQSSAASLSSALEKSAPANDALKRLGKAADKIREASDIAAARSAFQTVSQELAGMVETVGTSGSQDVFLMSCPMAFNNKGGDWLQNDKDLANPYFGSAMYKCGMVKDQLAENGEK